MSRGARGSALVMAMLILTIALALIVAISVRAIASGQATTRHENDVRALNAAEAGLAHAVQRLIADNVPGPQEGSAGLAEWAVEGSEELRAPSISVVTFDASARCRDRTVKLRLRLVVERDEELVIRDLRRLDWQRTR